MKSITEALVLPCCNGVNIANFSSKWKINIAFGERCPVSISASLHLLRLKPKWGASKLEGRYKGKMGLFAGM